ncbi:NAD(+) kinase [Halorubrum sp. JWXQ-INN 858]|uniref:NAD(+)/NADH kinase n=1 Tax=Halorubrum sp. JWXQ-INN 858 TaxID=2690782 RepID=UPI001356D285|nr:NAD(+)/NADH kinase [Halorubrum sp. JWXQ-INN 858]MWV64175.1 NAD(+) kinase [Halorubrum sp. JWXQ-INN 858]
MQVGIVARKGNPRAAALASDVRDAVAERDVSVWLDAVTAEYLDAGPGRSVSALADCDLAVAVGGDGTFLFAARNADGVPVLGVNLGEVGFLNAVPPDEAERAVLREVERFRDGGMSVREAPRLVATADGWESLPAANEVLVTGPRRGHGGGIDYELRVDGSLYSGGHADGVLVATPTGSTAYNLSERGPLVHPTVDGFIVNEMCAEEGMPPLAVGVDASVTVTVTSPGDVIVASDGRNPHELGGPVEVSVRRATPPMRIAGPPADFFEALGKLS